MLAAQHTCCVPCMPGRRPGFLSLSSVTSKSIRTDCPAGVASADQCSAVGEPGTERDFLSLGSDWGPASESAEEQEAEWEPERLHVPFPQAWGEAGESCPDQEPRGSTEVREDQR